MLCSIAFVTLLVSDAVFCSDPALEEEEIQARAYIQLLNDKTARRANRVTIASWNYASNITEENLKVQVSTKNEILAQCFHVYSFIIITFNAFRHRKRCALAVSALYHVQLSLALIFSVISRINWNPVPRPWFDLWTRGVLRRSYIQSEFF